MSPVKRTLTADALSFVLADEVEILRRDLDQAKRRVARTLVRNNSLSVTLVGVQPGGGLSEHTAPGPITVHVLEGSIELAAAGARWPLSAGMLLSLDGGVAHDVTSTTGGVFLLTLSAKGEQATRA